MTDRTAETEIAPEVRVALNEWVADPIRAATEMVAMRTALGQISRMRGSPDKVVCLTTIGAAREIAERALRITQHV